MVQTEPAIDSRSGVKHRRWWSTRRGQVLLVLVGVALGVAIAVPLYGMSRMMATPPASQAALAVARPARRLTWHSRSSRPRPTGRLPRPCWSAPGRMRTRAPAVSCRWAGDQKRRSSWAGGKTFGQARWSRYAGGYSVRTSSTRTDWLYSAAWWRCTDDRGHRVHRAERLGPGRAGRNDSGAAVCPPRCWRAVPGADAAALLARVCHRAGHLRPPVASDEPGVGAAGWPRGPVPGRCRVSTHYCSGRAWSAASGWSSPWDTAPPLLDDGRDRGSACRPCCAQQCHVAHPNWLRLTRDSCDDDDHGHGVSRCFL